MLETLLRVDPRVQSSSSIADMSLHLKVKVIDIATLAPEASLASHQLSHVLSHKRPPYLQWTAPTVLISNGALAHKSIYPAHSQPTNSRCQPSIPACQRPESRGVAPAFSVLHS